jgi:ATP-dependent protease ClpP protease subunit
MAQPKQQVLYDLHAHCMNPNTRDIYLHSNYNVDDPDGAEPGVDFRQATTFIKNLQFLDQPQYKPILVHMHSQGGSWDDGMAMFNAIQVCQSYVTILAYAQASSMSGVIFQSSHLRVMMPDCHFLMHHGVSGGATVHPFGFKNEAEFQMRAVKRMLQIFAERAVVGPYFKKKKSTTVASIYNFFDKKLKTEVDWYLNAEESVFYGLADCILGCEAYPNVQSLRE